MFMLSHPIRAEQEAEAGQHAQDAQFYRGVLHRLIEIGADMAETVHQTAKNEAETAAPEARLSSVRVADLTAAFDRLARTIRRCIVLARTVSEPVSVADGKARRLAARKTIIRRVEDAIHREAGAHEADALRAELSERMDAPEFEADLDRPIEEIIREIQADLGVLGPDGRAIWKRRTPRDIAQLWARAAAGSDTRSAPLGPAGFEPAAELAEATAASRWSGPPIRGP